MQNAHRHGPYLKNLAAAQATDTMREDIKRTLGMLVSALDHYACHKIAMKTDFVIADEDGEWTLQIVPQQPDKLIVWVDVNGEQMAICAATKVPETHKHVIRHIEIPSRLVLAIDQAMPTLFDGMIREFVSVRDLMQENIRIADYYASTRG